MKTRTNKTLFNIIEVILIINKWAAAATIVTTFITAPGAVFMNIIFSSIGETLNIDSNIILFILGPAMLSLLIAVTYFVGSQYIFDIFQTIKKKEGNSKVKKN